MRTWILALALITGAIAAPAYAQKTPTPPAPTIQVAPVQPNPTAASIAASREVLQFMFVDSGALDLAINRAFEQQLPNLRAEFAGPAFNRLSQSKRAAVNAFIDSLPAVALGEFQRVMPRLLDEAAADSATLFTETEIVDISEFFRASPARDVMVSYILRGVEESTPGVTPREVTMTSEQQTAIATFEATPSGQAFGRNSEAWLAVVQRHFNEVEALIGPAMEQRTIDGLCDALGSDCPPALRQRT